MQSLKIRQGYYKFSEYLKERFGCRVYKVGVDAGFLCPNKDGRLSNDGCIYCDNKAFSFNTRTPAKPIDEQIRAGMAFGRKRYGAEKFIIYFQAHTNTYAAPDILKERYDTIKKFDSIVGLSIGTRPDCVNEEILDLIESYSKDYEVWVEYGLQSIHNTTLALVNRNHTYEDFLKAVELTKKRNIKICAHIIIGLPNETRDDILETARGLQRLKIDSVKIHPLHIVKGTNLEKIYNQGLYKPLELEEFTDLTADFLERLGPDIIIQRIGADCPEELLVAPSWISKRND
jgi:uncharacterized protein